MRTCVQCGANWEADTWTCSACGFSPEVLDGFNAFASALADHNRGFPQEAFERLARVEDTSFWFRARNAVILWALKRYFPGVSHYLEIGCGSGYVLAAVETMLPETAVWGSDLYVSALRLARRRVPAATLVQMDATKIPFTDEFDAIGCFDTLEHIEEDEAALVRIWAALKPGGGLLLTVPQHDFLWSPSDDYAKHVRRYSRKELMGKLTMAGFRVQRMTSFVSLLLPLMLLSRKRRDGGEYDPEAEFRIPASVNRTFETIMNIELSVIRSGINLPMGGSLLAVARRPGA
jgi:SAM-dependent methyltransferase